MGAGFYRCANCCDRNSDCRCDDQCSMGPTGSTNKDFLCTTPRIVEEVKCPAGFYICPTCCSRSASCTCDHFCDATLANIETCAVPHRNAAVCPDNFTMCTNCCDRNIDCTCNDECGMGPGGRTNASAGFYCSIPHQQNPAVAGKTIPKEKSSFSSWLTMLGVVLGVFSCWHLVKFFTGPSTMVLASDTKH